MLLFMLRYSALELLHRTCGGSPTMDVPAAGDDDEWEPRDATVWVRGERCDGVSERWEIQQSETPSERCDERRSATL